MLIHFCGSLCSAQLGFVLSQHEKRKDGSFNFSSNYIGILTNQI